MNYYMTGSTVPLGVVIPSVSVASQLPTTLGNNWWSYATTGSIVYPEQDRTGQLVREDGEGDVYLVRESAGNQHTLVDASNGERTLSENAFWPWGVWRRVAG